MKTQEKIQFNNPVKVECFDKNGKLKWTRECFNGITDEGIQYLLGLGFRNVPTTSEPWFIGLVDNSTFVAFDDGDTAAQIGGTNDWDEFLNYSETPRQTWAADAPTGRTITNSTVATFTISGGGGDVKGIFIVDNSTKSSTLGTLWSTAAFSSVATVVALDELKITYTITG